MEEAMEQMMTDLGASDSTSKRPIFCEKCGKERDQVLVKHPFKDTKWWAPVVCECVEREMAEDKRRQEAYYKKRKIERALKNSSSLEDIKSMTFENYKARPGTERAVEEVKDAVRNFEERGKLGIFIFGETGNGKSHITSAGGNELIAKGYSVIFLTEKDLLSRFASTKNFNNNESFHEIMDACIKTDLLIWDDFLSSQKLTNEEKDWIFQIINGRERANRPIWATSNLTPQEFEDDRTAYKLDDKGRTWWRLIGNMNPIYNRATNYRKAKAMARALGMTVEEYESKGLMV